MISIILDQDDFTPESAELVKPMILGACFHATVMSYHYDNIPLIQLTKRYGRVKTFTNIAKRLPFCSLVS